MSEFIPMKLENLIKLINSDDGFSDMELGFPSIVNEISSTFDEHDSEIDGIDSVWIMQFVDCINSSGKMAYQLDDGRFLVFCYEA